jgi:hypothetical protein
VKLIFMRRRKIERHEQQTFGHAHFLQLILALIMPRDPPALPVRPVCGMQLSMVAPSGTFSARESCGQVN